MALQIKVVGPELAYAGDKFKDELLVVRYYLKCWEVGDNPETDVPIIGNTPDGKGMPFNGQCKTVVEGKTLDDLVSRVEQVAVKQMQKVINIHNKLEVIVEKQRVIDSSVNIQNALEG